jgi:hypothetical protein
MSLQVDFTALCTVHTGVWSEVTELHCAHFRSISKTKSEKGDGEKRLNPGDTVADTVISD